MRPRPAPRDHPGVGALVTVGAEEINIELSGLNSLSLRRRLVRIPIGAVMSIRASADEPDTIVAGIATPLTGVRTGVLERDGRSVLVVVKPGHPTVTFELDRIAFPELQFDTVVLPIDASQVTAR